MYNGYMDVENYNINYNIHFKIKHPMESNMTNQEFEQAVQEFLNNGGKVQTIPYQKPGASATSKGAVWSKGFSRSRASGYAEVDHLIK